MGYEWMGEYFWFNTNTKSFRNLETGVRFTPRRMCQYLNCISDVSHEKDIISKLYLENEWRKQYQRHLENKISRLKKRIQELEK